MNNHFVIEDVFTNGIWNVYISEVFKNNYLVSIPNITYSDIVTAGSVSLYKVPIDSQYMSDLNSEIEGMIEEVQQI